MTKVIAVNGKAGSGKDTFLDFVIENLKSMGFMATKHSSVDVVKLAATTLGWDGVKDAKGRQFLSDLKDLSTRSYEGPMNYMTKLVYQRSMGIDFMFFHIREPQEIKKFLSAIIRSESVIINRDGIEEFGNHADANVQNFSYHQTIDNNGTLCELKEKAIAYANYLIHGDSNVTG